jgi:hypothetical protein
VKIGDKVTVVKLKVGPVSTSTVESKDRHFVYTASGSRYLRNGQPVRYGQRTRIIPFKEAHLDAIKHYQRARHERKLDAGEGQE